MNAMWKGAIQFGMVTIPVRLYKATVERGGISFKLLCPCHHVPIKRFDQCAQTKKRLSKVMHGLRYGERYVVFDDTELSELDLDSNHLIELHEFVDKDAFEPALYVTEAYYVEAEPLGAKAYALLVRALGRAGKVGVGVVCLRNRERIASLRKVGDMLLLNTLQWPEEVRHVALTQKAALSRQEISMATTLIEELTTDFDPTKYRDRYREALQVLAESKLHGQKPKQAKAPDLNVETDLVAQLKASIDAAKRKPKRVA